MPTNSRDLRTFKPHSFPGLICRRRSPKTHLHDTGAVMFAVPGWNIGAKRPIAQQSVAAKERKQARDDGSNKRKRIDSGKSYARKINGNELEKLWDEQFGENVRGKTKKRTQEKRSTATQDIPVNGQAQSHVTKDKQKKSLPSKDRNSSRPKNDDKSSHKHNHNEGQTLSNSNGSSAPPATTETTAAIASNLPPPPPTTTSSLTPLQLKMRSKLTSARFRHLNQTLYTTPSATSLTLFQTTPSLFAEYHAGFSNQVLSSWPTNPVTNFITSIRTRATLTAPNGSTTPLPRRKTGSCTIADLGCGDAPLARALSPQTKKWALRFHNYDLHAPNEHVTVADIANLPLRDGEADIAVFCLSLMGTNWLEFVEEAWRVLRGDGKGECWVAEVKSRFGRVVGGKGRVVENSVGKKRKVQATKNDDEGLGLEVLAESVRDEQEGNDTDTSAFVKVFERRGFKLKEGSVDKTNKMFVSMIFYKSGVPSAGKHKSLKWTGKEYQQVSKQDGRPKFVESGRGEEEIDPSDEAKVLKPCVYKTR